MKLSRADFVFAVNLYSLEMLCTQNANVPTGYCMYSGNSLPFSSCYCKSWNAHKFVQAILPVLCDDVSI